MPPEESKPIDPKSSEEAVEEAIAELQKAESTDDEAETADTIATDGASVASSSAAKKKKSKKKKLKDVLIGTKDGTDTRKLSSGQLEQILELNPSLKAEMADTDPKEAQELLRKLNMADLLTGLTVGGKNQKDMASYKFWQTQPVPSFEDKGAVEEGPIKTVDPEKIPNEPSPLYEGFEWVTMDLENPSELEEVHHLLRDHYVEDDEAMFRFNYSPAFLDWALKAPGWRKEWHVGVRATASRKLVAFISGIPIRLRVRKITLSCSEINFLCIHKKLRSKRLAPVLIKEITRRCYRVGIFQAIYIAGVVLPKPVATCRYFHRSLDWEKLHEVGFSPLPPGSTPNRQILKYKLPEHTETHGLRSMEAKDVDSVLDLLERYLGRIDMAQSFTKEEVAHWLLNRESDPSNQVVWSYVVEDSQTKKITDFFSFYCLESTVIGSKKYSAIRAAYLFYYATESAFDSDLSRLKPRLNKLMRDVLILAKKANFDVFNALTLMDNPLFLESQKFGAGDGQLHYYLYNYRTPTIAGGVDQKNVVSEQYTGGVGVVML